MPTDYYCPIVCSAVRLSYYRIYVLPTTSYTKEGCCATGMQHMRAKDLSRDPRLTKEQDAMRLRGLRILARMIVRAHLVFLTEQDSEKNGSVPNSTRDSDIPTKGG